MRANTVRTARAAVVPVMLALLLSACAAMTPPPPRTSEEIASDSAITRQVLAAIGDYSHRVDVRTERGVVYMSGNLVDRDEADEVMRLAGTVKGVKFIQDNFEVQWDHKGSFLRYWGR